jgi:hypothetical protein
MISWWATLVRMSLASPTMTSAVDRSDSCSWNPSPVTGRIVKIYSNDASGATTDRADLQKMLRTARAGLFDTVLVYRVDRFSRRLRD